jgi:hypothetical protein
MALECPLSYTLEGTLGIIGLRWPDAHDAISCSRRGQLLTLENYPGIPMWKSGRLSVIRSTCNLSGVVERELKQHA